MKRFFVFLFGVSILSIMLLALDNIDQIISFFESNQNHSKFAKINLSKHQNHVSEMPIPKEYEDWRVAYAHYYDPSDPNQTKEHPDTIGASNRKIESGSIAMDLAFIINIANNYKDRIVYIQIRRSKIKTKFCRDGEYGVFRVDDTKNPRYVGNYVEFFQNDFFRDRNNMCYIKNGEYYAEFRILRIDKIKETATP